MRVAGAATRRLGQCPVWAASDLPPFRARVIYSLSSSHSGPSALRSSCAFARGAPLDPGRLRRPWETSNSPKPSRGFQPEKGRFRPPLSSPLADGHSPSPPAPPGSLSSWDQRGGLPLSGHSTARTIRHLSLHPFRRLRRLIQDCRGTRLRPIPEIRDRRLRGSAIVPKRPFVKHTSIRCSRLPVCSIWPTFWHSRQDYSLPVVYRLIHIGRAKTTRLPTDS